MSGRVKALFGKPLRALLAAWVLAQDGTAFYLQEVQLALAPFGAAPSGVATELRVLVAHGMLLETEDGRRVYFTRIGGPLWAIYEAMVSAFDLNPTSRESESRRSSPAGEHS